MRLSRIAITNHSRIPNLDVEIRRHAVIVGANDVGKSSVLRMLDLTLGTSTAGLYQALTPGDVRDLDRPLIVDVAWSDFTEENRRVFPSEISIAADQEREYLWVQMVVEVDPEDETAVSIRRHFPEAHHERAPTREQLEAFGWRYLRATRGTSLIKGTRSPVQTLLSAADLGENEQTLRKLLQQFNEELSGNETVSELLERVAGHLNRALPGRVTSTDFTIRSETDPTDDVLQNVSIFFKRNGEDVSLLEQSDGIRHLMSMALFDLAEGTANVIAIDEPELHLHPTSQRTAAELLSGEGNQKIIATHSPYILHRFEPEEVIAINHMGRCHQISRGDLSRVEKVRAHWWSPRLLEALTSRFVILVEGDADRVIVEAVAKLLNVDLDRLGAVVMELDGADKFRNVFPLLGPNGFGPTLLGLVDQEESASWVNAFKTSPGNIIDKTIFVSASDLEDEYTRALGGPAAARALIEADFCREQAILQASQRGSLDDLTPEDVAKFCRRKGKVDAATCIADSLNEGTARAIGSVTRLLNQLEVLSAK